ncbi:MAG: Eco57I restriction-modification methylase domain-containing protein [Nitrospinales bacterium]
MSTSDVIELSHRFELFIPTQCICGKNIDDQLRVKALDLVKGKFHDWFGGATVKPVNGIWKLPDGTIADEKVDIVDSLADEDAYDDYLDEVKRLAVSIADKLSQDRVLLKIDEKGFLFARSDDKAKCSHKTKTKSADDRPVIDVPKNDPVLIYYTLSRFSSLRDARHLFCNVLNYKMIVADLPTGNWPQSTKALLKEIPEIIADTNGFRIVYIRLTADRLLRAPERQIIKRIYQDDPTFRGLFVISDADQENWEFVNAKTQGEKASKMLLRRMKVGTDAVRTATERIIMVQINENEEKTITAADLQLRHDEAFDVESVTKQFYKELSDWYFWALTLVDFPDDVEKNTEVRNAENVIRLITRLIFIWFLKEKGLVPAALFKRKGLETILDFSKEKTGSAYYKAILQNLFFATLNVPMDEREFRVEKRYKGKNKDYMNHLVFRYANLFFKDNCFQNLFCEIPFLNGGLFDCLDFLQDGKQMRIDCFSDNPKNMTRLKVPDELFFGKAVVDLSEIYDDRRRNAVKVRGIIDILSSYNFTLEENTPVEEEIALDPELLGRVFENLLASYNPETKTTARKQTGSFYTPRVIVNYMVDESLKAYLVSILGEDKAMREKLDQLLEYDGTPALTDRQKQQVIDALEDVKILDPACGSGAFPMGVLQKMVHILEKLDPGNEKWKETMIKRTPAEIRKETERMLATNSADYIRKLGIIQNCIYGVDIQPIAIQVSQLRFFISLLVDFTVEKERENSGVHPMPNLDYKFMQGNSLIEDFHGFTLNMRDQETIKGPSQLFSENEEVEAMIADLWEKQGSFMRETQPKKKDRLREEVEQDIVNIFDAHIRQKKAPYFAELRRIEDMGARIPNQKQREKYLVTEKTKIDRKHKFDYLLVEKELKELTQGYIPRNFFPWQLYFADVFNKKGGFDIVIGNPPYIKEYVNKNAFDGLRQSPYYQGKMDIWYLFACKGIDLLNYNGILAFIAQNNWVTSYGARIMRKKVLSDSRILQLLDFGDYKIFENVGIQTMVMLFQKSRNTSDYLLDYRRIYYSSKVSFKDVLDVLSKTENEHIEFLTPEIKKENLIDQPITFNDKKVEKILTKILNESNFKINENEAGNGIHHHHDVVNKARNKILGNGFVVGQGIFILSDEEKKSISFTKDELKLIKPQYTTRELFKYYGNVKNRYWVIYTNSSFNNMSKIKKYPSIKKHLDRFREVITSDNKPYGLHRARNEKFFRGEKIVAVRKCAEPTFTYTDFDCYVSATFYVIKSERINMKFLTALLNSKMIAFWLRHKGKMQGNNYQIDKDPLLCIPILKPELANQISIIKIVDNIILLIKDNDLLNNQKKQAQVKTLAQKIDRLVYKLYALTDEEIALVEGK